MLTITLTDEAEKYLVEILAQEKITSGELLQRMLHRHWQDLQPRKTVLERMGDRPRHFLSGSSNLSDRDVRKKLIAEHVQKRHEREQN
ncbi:MAG: hypothetical protein LH660_05350 [Phormidesmis sp. CAN_BIN36]|nr:hypothetical protein [Phormidesmis sp. CAN_BIN36]